MQSIERCISIQNISLYLYENDRKTRDMGGERRKVESWIAACTDGMDGTAAAAAAIMDMER